MPAEVFWDSTFREVSRFLEAEQWRKQETRRLLRYAAWHTALLHHVGPKKFPSLEKIVGGTSARPHRQTAPEQKAALLAWKAIYDHKKRQREERARG